MALQAPHPQADAQARAEGSPPQQLPPALAAAPPELHVLGVDDAPLNLLLVSRLLLRHGFAKVSTAADGERCGC